MIVGKKTAEHIVNYMNCTKCSLGSCRPSRRVFYRGYDDADVMFIGDAPKLTPEQMSKGAFFILLPENLVKERKQSIKIELWEGDKLLEATETNFLGPIK